MSPVARRGKRRALRTYNDLTQAEKTVVRRQAIDALMNERAQDVWRAVAPSWLSQTDATNYLAIADKCRRAGVGPMFFACTVYGDTGLKAAFAAEALQRCEAARYLDAGEAPPSAPVVGEAVAGL